MLSDLKMRLPFFRRRFEHLVDVMAPPDHGEEARSHHLLLI
jgi:hypothetical protein